MTQSQNNTRTVSSAAKLSAPAQSSVLGRQQTHTTSIFHTGDNALQTSTTSIFRVGNAYQNNAQSSIAHSRTVSSDSEGEYTENMEKVRDDRRYAYIQKNMKRKQVSEALKGHVSDDVQARFEANKYSTGDLRKIRVGIDQAVAVGKMSGGEGKRLKYTLGEI